MTNKRAAAKLSSAFLTVSLAAMAAAVATTPTAAAAAPVQLPACPTNKGCEELGFGKAAATRPTHRYAVIVTGFVRSWSTVRT